LSAALDLAGSIVQRDSALNPEIVLLTDGWQTASSAPPLDALPSGVAVSYVPLPASTSAQQPVAVTHAIHAPTVARAGDHIEVQLELQASQAIDAQLLLRVDQRVVASGPVHLGPGDTQLSLPATITAPGFV